MFGVPSLQIFGLNGNNTKIYPDTKLMSGSIKPSTQQPRPQSLPHINMKWNSSNSSLSSVSDRKSIFYTDADLPSEKVHSDKYVGMNDVVYSATGIRNVETNSDVEERKQENGATHSFRNHIKLVSKELDCERKFRDDQLSKILKALIYFEAKLKNEQKVIRQQLYEKDDLINRQNYTINSMKRKLGDVEDDIPKTGEISQFCPKCRKNYYLYEYKNIATQTVEKVLEIHDNGNPENISLNSVEYASSSEEPDSTLLLKASSFNGARRSRKYTSKRSYKGYTKSRQNSFKSDTNSYKNNSNTDNETYENITPHINVPKIAIYENYESDKENKIQDTSHSYDNVTPYSLRINNLHGIRQSNSQNSLDQNTIYDKTMHDEDKRTSKNDNMFETEEEEDDSVFYGVNTTKSKVNQQKYTEGMEMKQTIETNDDWYASASDMEDSDSSLGKPYGNAAVNPVLECVNQILVQQSMEGFSEHKCLTNQSEQELENKPKDNQSRDNTQPRSKRVHFSTQNSMVQVPRLQMQARKEDKCSPTYEIQSIYSNEYEPIGSEQNSYSNYYVDMESKLGSEDRDRDIVSTEKRKTPPALPPKPANLLKLQQISKQRMMQIKTKPSTPNQELEPADSEPDYCSISEIQDSVKCVQIVAEIHKDACEDDYSIVEEETASKKSLDLEESFADIPKLPNVAEIVPPKKDVLNKYINQDNYITKSNHSSPLKMSSSKTDGEFKEQLSEIIAEINKQSPAIRNAIKKQVVVPEKTPDFKKSNAVSSLTFSTSKLKPVEKMSFLSKMNSNSISNLSMPSKLNSPCFLRNSNSITNLNTKTFSNSSLNFNGNMSQFQSPSKLAAYKSNTKSALTLNSAVNKPVHVNSSSPTKKQQFKIIEDNKMPIQAEFDWYNLDVEYGKSSQPDIILETDANSPTPNSNDTIQENGKNNNDNQSASEMNGNDTGKVEYNLDEEYKNMKPIIQPPDIIQKNSMLTNNMSHNNLTFKELVALNETPKIDKKKSKTVDGNYEHFLDDSGLCSKPIILPRKKRVYYSGPFV